MDVRLPGVRAVLRRAELAAAAAVVLAAFGMPPAQADDPEWTGDCGYSSAHTEPVVSMSDGGRWTGTFHLWAVVAEADVWCEVRVNGVPHDVLGPVHVVGAGAAADVLTYTTTSQTDDVDHCLVVRFADGTAEETCYAHTSWCDPVCHVRQESGPLVRQAGTEVCARTGEDVYAGDLWVVDCPPYGPY